METKEKVITTFSTMGEANFIELEETILKSMRNNPHFETTTPSLDEIEEAHNAFHATLANAASGAREAVAIKNEKRKVLDALLNKLGKFINLSYEGNHAVLLTTGFKLSKEAKKGLIPEATKRIDIKDGRISCSLSVDFDKIPHAKDYIVLYSTDASFEESATTQMLSGKTRVEITDLEKGKEYFVKVAGTSTAADKERNYNFSNIVSRIAQ